MGIALIVPYLFIRFFKKLGSFFNNGDGLDG